jgi:prepilin-type N-terminal cleavage/methylation domain-containing protein
MNKTKKTGFSLVELLVVISIIAVLTAILMMNLVGARERAKDSQKIQNIVNLKNALRLYYNDNQTYPANQAAILGNGFTGYMSGLGDTSFTYTLITNDSFKITIPLESGAGNDDINSQIYCGETSTTDKSYEVCSN